MKEQIAKVSKAIAGVVAAVVVTYLAKKNVVIEGGEVSTIVEYGVSAALGFLFVYLAPKNKD